MLWQKAPWKALAVESRPECVAVVVAAYMCMHEYVCDQFLTEFLYFQLNVLVISVSPRLSLPSKQAKSPFFLIFAPNYL